MALTKQEIRRQSIPQASYVSPHHGDGGWHGSSFGSERFDCDWQPLNDRILVRRLPDDRRPSPIVLPEALEQHRAVIVKVGPGKWIDGARQPLEVKPGDVVIIGPHVDWDSFGGEYALCQEADVRVVVELRITWPS